MNTSKNLCETAASALLSLWNFNSNTAWRSSYEYNKLRKTTWTKKRLYPTATAHAVLAFSECGFWSHETRYDSQRELIQTNLLTIPNSKEFPNPKLCLERILGVSLSKPKSDWISDLLGTSSHNLNNASSPRVVITLGHIASALRALVQANIVALPADVRQAVIRCIEQLTEHLLLVLKSGHSSSLHEIAFLNNRFLSPHLLLNAATVVMERKRVFEILDYNGNTNKTLTSALTDLETALLGYFARQVDFHMARHNVNIDHDYDPTSLVFSLRALSLLDAGAREKPFYRAAVQAIVQAQRPDGCWPDGISVTYNPNGDALQQPSVELALNLSEAVFHQGLLTHIKPSERTLLEASLPALRKCAEFLASTYRQLKIADGNVAGWASDRVRTPGLVETWITAMATRVIRNLSLAECASSRADILSRYTVIEPVYLHNGGSNWNTQVFEPDKILTPVKELTERVVSPLLKQQASGEIFCKPSHNGVSFIIYGPPGSGKTYFVTKMAEALGWPLVNLNPGHFIEQGMEFVEAKTSEIFRDLMALRHVVVFFDECDELFRTREEVSGSHRNILSFVTACMLPKLQQLHDQRNVVFILGTNYVSRIDAAVRRQGRFDGILLFDRPDLYARSKIISNELAKHKMHKLSRSHLKALSTGMAGWLITEIIDYIQKNGSPKKLTTSRDVSDYVEWCNKYGPAELLAAGVTEKRRNLVMKRWQELPGVSISKK